MCASAPAVRARHKAEQEGGGGGGSRNNFHRILCCVNTVLTSQLAALYVACMQQMDSSHGCIATL